jgi:two-component system phosphate regulon response regulator PhoB
VAAGQAVELSPKEFKLLHFLMAHPDRVHSRSQLLNRVWGDHVFIDDRTVDVHIKRLRQALRDVGADGPLETVRGMGYRFNSQR